MDIKPIKGGKVSHVSDKKKAIMQKKKADIH